MRSSWLAGLLVAAFVSVAHAAAVQPQSQEQSPTNDNFANAAVLANTANATMGSLYYATHEVGEARYSKTSLRNTVWYKFTATQTGRAVALLTTASTDQVPLQLQAFTGATVASLTRLGRTQIGTGFNPFNAGGLAFNTVAGNTYYLQVDSDAQADVFFKSDFLIAAQQFGASGGLGMLTYRPAFILDGQRESLDVLVANGLTSKATLRSSIAGITTKLSVTPRSKTLTVGQTAWLMVNDEDNSVSGAATGKLQLTAVNASTSIPLGTRSVPLTLIGGPFSSDHGLLVRFAVPVQGIIRSHRFSSTVNIKNISSSTAERCHFISGPHAVSLIWNEDLPDGKRGSTNAMFSLASGSTRAFTVSAATNDSLPSKDNWVTLSCSNYFGKAEPDWLEVMGAVSQLGYYAAVKMNVPAANAFQQIAVPDFGTRKVVVAITNIGRYSGPLQIQAVSSNSTVSMDYMCVSNSRGTCIDETDPYTVHTDLANGETGYLAITVTRQSATDSGLIYVHVVHDEDLFGTYMAGADGFEVME